VFDPVDPLSAIRWLAVKNSSGETAPAYAVMKVTGYEASTGAFTVTKPDEASISPVKLLVNSAGPIANGEYGSATRDFPVLAKVASGSAGDEVGTTASSWELSNDESGFNLWQDVGSSLAVVNAVGGSGGTVTGGTRRVRIDDTFVQDTDPPVTPPLSPGCYYPGTVMKWVLPSGMDAGGWTATSEEVWVVFYRDLGHVPGTPPTTVIADGTVAYDASPELDDDGNVLTYAPDDGEHDNAGESRPVWGSSWYAAGWAIVCDPGDDELDLEL
jgi:hypothetical protein